MSGNGIDDSQLYVSDDEEPIHRSKEGILIYNRRGGVLVSSKNLKDSDGPDGVISSVDEFQTIAVDLPQIVEEASDAE